MTPAATNRVALLPSGQPVGFSFQDRTANLSILEQLSEMKTENRGHPRKSGDDQIAAALLTSRQTVKVKGDDGKHHGVREVLSRLVARRDIREELPTSFSVLEAILI